MIANRFVHGDGFAGQGGFIHGRVAFQHRAIHRDGLARPDDEHIALFYLGNGHDTLLSAG